MYPFLSFFNIAYFENVFLNQCIHPFLVNGQNVCEVVLRYLQRLNALLCSSIYKDLTCFYQDARWRIWDRGRPLPQFSFSNQALCDQQQDNPIMKWIHQETIARCSIFVKFCINGIFLYMLTQVQKFCSSFITSLSLKKFGGSLI